MLWSLATERDGESLASLTATTSRLSGALTRPMTTAPKSSPPGSKLTSPPAPPGWLAQTPDAQERSPGHSWELEKGALGVRRREATEEGERPEERCEQGLPVALQHACKFEALHDYAHHENPAEMACIRSQGTQNTWLLCQK